MYIHNELEKILIEDIPTVARKGKTPQHFRKRRSISQNAAAFHKTQQHFTKHNSISQNTTAFHKTPQHFTLDGKGIPLGRTLLVCDWTEPAREALL